MRNDSTPPDPTIVTWHTQKTERATYLRTLPHGEKVPEPNPFDFFAYEALWHAELDLKNIERQFPCLKEGTC